MQTVLEVRLAFRGRLAHPPYESATDTPGAQMDSTRNPLTTNILIRNLVRLAPEPGDESSTQLPAPRGFTRPQA